MNRIAEPGTGYGGPWTIEKLEILERYLDAYTTALKDQPFRLMYIDAFAGTGHVELGQSDPEAEDFIRGSATRAVSIGGKPFDKLVFIEKDRERCEELDRLRGQYPGRAIQVENSDANEFLSELQQNWTQWRGVLFLDPFGTQVEWSTIETIAGYEALDTWILFPVSAIARMLPTSRRPDDIAEGLVTRLTKVFGDDEWRKLYRVNSQGNLFGQAEHERDSGTDELLRIYKDKLSALFGDRFLDQSRSLRNSKNSVLFEFLFCVGSRSPKAIAIAKRVARYILEHL